jgi:hypothetical protein
MDVAASARYNASGTYGTTSITTATTGAEIVVAFASLANGTAWQNYTCTDPATLVEEADSANGATCSLAIADAVKASAGATGASNALPLPTPGVNAGILLALRPIKVRRITNVGAGYEIGLAHKERTTKLSANVEYNPAHKARTSKIAVMVEYAVPTSRVLGPALQSN